VSSENVEKAQEFYPSERIDLAPLLSQENAVELLEEQLGSNFHPDFETVDASGGTITGTRELRGMQGFVDGFREWFSSWDSWRVLADDFIESGDKVLVMLDVIGRSRSDVEIAQRAANVLTFRDGRIARVEIHLDAEAARRSVGIEPG
jgi:ketosteroid isomerase-like protein